MHRNAQGSESTGAIEHSPATGDGWFSVFDNVILGSRPIDFIGFA